VEPTWRVIGASVQGTSHEKVEMVCQDAHAYRILSDGVILAAVADGAGSADRSDQGAHCAVERALACIEAVLDGVSPEDDTGWEALLAEAFCQARNAIAQLAKAEGLAPRAFATTLTCAVVADKCLAVGQIGDGIAIAEDEDGNLFAASHPQHGEYANETYFLTMEEALKEVQVWIYDQPVTALVLMTDGLIRLAMNLAENKPHLPFFRPLLAFAAQVDDEQDAQEQLEAFLASERVCKRTDDDKTLVLVSRRSETEPGTAPDEDADA
jgi:hypothetical protein